MKKLIIALLGTSMLVSTPAWEASPIRLSCAALTKTDRKIYADADAYAKSGRIITPVTDYRIDIRSDVMVWTSGKNNRWNLPINSIKNNQWFAAEAFKDYEVSLIVMPDGTYDNQFLYDLMLTYDDKTIEGLSGACAVAK